MEASSPEPHHEVYYVHQRRWTVARRALVLGVLCCLTLTNVPTSDLLRTHFRGVTENWPFVRLRSILLDASPQITEAHFSSSRVLLESINSPLPSLRRHRSTVSTRSSANSQIQYGWTPEVFPNPSEDPIRCGIEPLIKTQQQQDDELWFCDPDYVLGEAYLEKVAIALWNFSHTFGPTRGSYREGDEEWNVQVQQEPADSERPKPSRRNRSLTRTPTNHNSSINLSFPLHSTNQRHLLAGDSIRRFFPLKAEGQEDDPPQQTFHPPVVSLAVAVVRKMNLQKVLSESTYLAYEDEDDMVNDAAQYFARYVHDEWWEGNPVTANDASNTNGILIFLSVQDRVCFISTGAAISSILPWWRLEHVVSNMKPDLRHRGYGEAILRGIQALTEMLRAGPPTLSDRLHDFVARFGVVIAFAFFTFFFGAYGEYRDRRKRWQYAERRSRLNAIDKEKARQLQRSFHNVACPICLEEFDVGKDGQEEEKEEEAQMLRSAEKSRGVPRVDSYGIPLVGSDGEPVKMLRCGHIFDDTCWKCWVNSGHGNPCQCPVCRQDVGRGPNSHSRQSRPRSSSTRETTPLMNSNAAIRRRQQVSATQGRILTHPNYDSVSLLRAGEDRRDRLLLLESSPVGTQPLATSVARHDQDTVRMSQTSSESSSLNVPQPELSSTTGLSEPSISGRDQYNEAEDVDIFF